MYLFIIKIIITETILISLHNIKIERGNNKKKCNCWFWQIRLLGHVNLWTHSSNIFNTVLVLLQGAEPKTYGDKEGIDFSILINNWRGWIWFSSGKKNSSDRKIISRVSLSDCKMFTVFDSGLERYNIKRTDILHWSTWQDWCDIKYFCFMAI